MAKTYTIEEVTIIQRGTNLIDDIYCHVKFAECSKPVPIYAHRLSESEFERDLNQRLENKEFGDFSFPPSDYSTHPLTMIQREQQAKAQRDDLLIRSDWTEVTTQLPLAKRTEWATYRQQLRDITAQPGFPWEVIWPTKPA